MMKTAALLDALNTAADTLIGLDPDAARRLEKLRGKVVCLDITAPPVKLYLLPTPQGIEFRYDSESVPDVTLTGSAMAFARLGVRMSRADGAADGLSEGRVTLRGDAELGQAFGKILAELDPDWEELLSRRIGDTPARKAGNAIRGLAGWAAKSAGLTRENAADYLTEEKRLLVTPPAMERFAQTLDRTRADVDRLARRVAKLRRAAEEGR